MIVVSDTTPLNYLVLIGLADVLEALFQEVYVPSAVLAELLDEAAPEVVRRWAGRPPAWLIVADPTTRLASTARLEDGEAAAISLAKERRIQDVLIDEWFGRKVAVAEGLSVLPTLAVLERAAERDLLNLPSAIAALQRTTFRVRPERIEEALERDAARRRGNAP